jgi:hypothetical protein
MTFNEEFIALLKRNTEWNLIQNTHSDECRASGALPFLPILPSAGALG